MIELFILVSGMGMAYCVGNIMGFSSGRRYVEDRIVKTIMRPSLEMEMNRPRNLWTDRNIINLDEHRDTRTREDLIDEISRNSLTYCEKEKHWMKVYDAEVIDE